MALRGFELELALRGFHQGLVARGCALAVARHALVRVVAVPGPRLVEDSGQRHGEVGGTVVPLGRDQPYDRSFQDLGVLRTQIAKQLRPLGGLERFLGQFCVDLAGHLLSLVVQLGDELLEPIRSHQAAVDEGRDRSGIVLPLQQEGVVHVDRRNHARAPVEDDRAAAVHPHARRRTAIRTRGFAGPHQVRLVHSHQVSLDAGDRILALFLGLARRELHVDTETALRDLELFLALPLVLWFGGESLQGERFQESENEGQRFQPPHGTLRLAAAVDHKLD